MCSLVALFYNSIRHRILSDVEEVGWGCQDLLQSLLEVLWAQIQRNICDGRFQCDNPDAPLVFIHPQTHSTLPTTNQVSALLFSLLFSLKWFLIISCSRILKKGHFHFLKLRAGTVFKDMDPFFQQHSRHFCVSNVIPLFCAFKATVRPFKTVN